MSEETEVVEAEVVETPTPKQTEMTDTPKSRLPATIGTVAVADRGYIAPTNAQEAYELARLLSSVAGSSFSGDISKIAVAIMAGQEAGLGPVYSVMNIAIINGRPSMYGDAILALIQASGRLEDYQLREIGTSFDRDTTEINKWPDDFGVTVTMKRKGQETPYVGKFTVGDAKRAKLWMNTKKVPWIEHPMTMLERRALGKSARKGFADVLAGLSVREEMEDMGTITPEPIDTSFLSDDAPVNDEAQPAQAE